ncbi:MAG: FIG01123047: hypothetical protein, partial [uncultured Gemmatimonadetes bacterium]
ARLLPPRRLPLQGGGGRPAAQRQRQPLHRGGRPLRGAGHRRGGRGGREPLHPEVPRARQVPRAGAEAGAPAGQRGGGLGAAVHREPGDRAAHRVREAPERGAPAAPHLEPHQRVPHQVGRERPELHQQRGGGGEHAAVLPGLHPAARGI